jgi:hypothetical protein
MKLMLALLLVMCVAVCVVMQAPAAVAEINAYEHDGDDDITSTITTIV